MRTRFYDFSLNDIFHPVLAMLHAICGYLCTLLVYKESNLWNSTFSIMNCKHQDSRTVHISEEVTYAYTGNQTHIFSLMM